MSVAFSVRVEPELLAESKRKAIEAGESFTAYVCGALRARNAGKVSIADESMQPACKHPWRDTRDVCRVCGDQRPA